MHRNDSLSYFALHHLDDTMLYIQGLNNRALRRLENIITLEPQILNQLLTLYTKIIIRKYLTVSA